MNKKLIVLCVIVLTALSVLFYVLSSYKNKTNDFEGLLNEALNKTLSVEMTPYNKLTDEQKEERWGHLISAISSGNLEVANKLMQNVEINPADEKSCKLLLYAVRADKNSGQLTELLINAGFTDVNIIVLAGEPLLHLAAYKGNVEAVEVLIKHGANVNCIDVDSQFGLSSQRTPLHVSAQYGTWEVAQILLENGADINAKNRSGFTPLDVALWKADPDHESVSGKQKVAKLIRHQMEITTGR